LQIDKRFERRGIDLYQTKKRKWNSPAAPPYQISHCRLCSVLRITSGGGVKQVDRARYKKCPASLTKTIDRRLVENTGEGFADFYKKHSDEGKVSLRRAQVEVSGTRSSTTRRLPMRLNGYQRTLAVGAAIAKRL
jgi:hypothetical protein